MLILDEPTVGLDPNQIIEIRSLIKSLGKHHTVILSSHILPEIQAVCDRIVIISGGKIVADDTAANLSAQYSDDRSLSLRVAGPEAEVKALLQKIPGVERVVSLGEKEKGTVDFAVYPKSDTDVRREIFTRLADRGWALFGMTSMQMTLEDIFITLTHRAEGGN